MIDWLTFVFFLIIVVIGVPGNLFILRVYIGRKRKTSTDVLLISLALSDLVFCWSTPFFMAALLQPCNGGSHISCKLRTSIKLITLYYSILLTGAIALDRYYAVCKPLSRIITPKRSAIIAVLCYVLSMFIGGILGFDSSVITNPSVKLRNDTNCTICAAATGISKGENDLGLLTAIVYFAAILVFVAIVVLYGFVYVTVRRQVKVRAAMGMQQSTKSNRANVGINSVSFQADTSTCEESSLSNRQRNESGSIQQRNRGAKSSQIMQQKITRMLVAITILLWGTWTPSAILIYFKRMDSAFMSRLSPANKEFLSFLNYLYYINYGVNFIVYIITNDRFRQETIDILKNKCKRLPMTSN